MTHLEQVNQSLEQLNTCPSSGISEYFSTVMRMFPYINKAEKAGCALSFYEWAQENTGSEPLKFFYAQFLLGLSHHLSDEHESALRLFTEARKNFTDHNDNDGVGLCAVLLGSVYRTLGNFDLALKALWEGYSMLKQTERYFTTLSACTNSMANIYLELHNYDEALSFFNITYETSSKIDDYYFKIYALHGLGKVNIRKNNLAEARVFLEEALVLAKKHDNALAIGNSLTELANFYFRSDDYDEAEKLNRQALLTREQHQYTGAAVTNYIHLGEIFIRQSKWDEALDVLNKGLKMAEQIKVKPKMFQIHFLLSEIYHKQKDMEKSLFHYKQFHELREEVEKEDYERKLSDAKLIFEAEQTKKENIIIKAQKTEIENKNHQLQDTIDELTITRVSRKAKVLTFILGIALIVAQDPVFDIVLSNIPHNYFYSIFAKVVIILSLKPIDIAIQNYLLKRVVLNRRKAKQAIT
ncbi:MAG TPA: tetratricopeptide repeat protein [Chitinophagales bacterium]|nr:tetratricopeptide repeat protein [Chitinophagales bacterium]